MTEQTEDYSDYIKHLSNLANGLIFIIGFMFTVITILLFLLWGLTTLATANLIIWLINLLATYQYVLKPFRRHRKKHTHTKQGKKDEESFP